VLLLDTLVLPCNPVFSHTNLQPDDDKAVLLHHDMREYGNLIREIACFPSELLLPGTIKAYETTLVCF
jgi:hypothetical protein